MLNNGLRNFVLLLVPSGARICPATCCCADYIVLGLSKYMILLATAEVHIGFLEFSVLVNDYFSGGNEMCLFSHFYLVVP